MESKKIHRREFIAGGLGAGAMALGLGVRPSHLQAHASGPEAIGFPFPKPQVPLDVDAVRQTAYDRYFQGGCMFGAAASLIEAFRSACRSDGAGGGYSDWDLIPTDMFKYGSGGVAGWGTICGILNGAAAVLAMADYGSLIGQVIGWYTLQSFPLDNCEGFTAASGFEALADIDVPAHTVSDSPLCHISISKFCEAAGITLQDSSPEGLNYKQDRCSKICADTAALSAQLINGELDSESVYTTPASYDSCLTCHGTIKDQVGKMNCLGCHSTSDVILVGSGHGSDLKPPKSRKKR